LTNQPVPGGGYRDAVEVAREKAAWILENHHPEPLDEAQQTELRRILQTAEQELA
jgi:trimethylamine:corrinoid methyltransferase-like protein